MGCILPKNERNDKGSSKRSNESENADELNKFAQEGKIGIRPKLINVSGSSSVEDNYKFIKAIGSGMTGDVWEVENKHTNKKFAIKRVKKRSYNEKSLDKMKDEIEFLREMDHPNIIRLYESYEDESMMYIVMEVF